MHFKKLSILFYFIFSTNAYSSPITDEFWYKLLQKYQIPAENQSYCYVDENGNIEGSNPDIKIRLASVSKLITSLWALNVMDQNFKYNTQLFFKDNNLHMAGSFDPFLGDEKMFYLISKLNDLGITHLDKLSFDKLILINPNVQIPNNEYPVITRQSNTQNLYRYLNTKNWTPEIWEQYSKVRLASPEGVLRKFVQFEVQNISYSETNPYEHEANIKQITLSSPPLYKYLKEMNIESNNFVAHTIFLQLGGRSAFENFMLNQFGINSEKIHFYTGSGLPIYLNGDRYDNYSTCRTIVKLMKSLNQLLQNKNLELKDIMAVPGSDKGTFANRIFPANLTNSFMAKTGSLYNTSTLAGAMNTMSGFSYFGIFNQTTDIDHSQLIQNKMVELIIKDHQGPLLFDYNAQVFHTY